MIYLFEELIDVQLVQELTDQLYRATGIPSAIISLDGKIVTGAGWQRVCTDFHRQHEQTQKDCIESDTQLRERVNDGEEYIIYRCPRGLVDACTPVRIKGVHMANVFAGQLFMEPLDEKGFETFRQQAREFGFDEEAYLEAVREVPVLPEDRFRPALDFLAKFAQLVATIGLARMDELDAAAELTDNERKYRRLLESTASVPWELDLASGRFTYMGPQAERVLGYPASHWVDQEAWERTIHPEDRPPATRLCQEETEAGRDHDLTYRIVLPDGSTRWIHDGVTVLKENGVAVKLVGFMRDVTDQQQMVLERRRMEEQIQRSQRIEAVGALAGGIAHDFNNLLGAIVGFTELARLDLDDDSEAAESLDDALETAHRAKKLIQQILTFSRRSEVTVRVMTPAPVVQTALDMLRSTLPSTVEIHTDIDADAGPVRFAAAQLDQLILNLATNAHHAMAPRGGKLSVTLALVDVSVADATHLTELHSGKYVLLTVSDTGQGMPPEVQARIFEPYFTTKGVSEGTGLGLSVVHGIVTTHGGAIGVHSVPGEGTTFEVYLPVVAGRVKTPSTHELQALPVGSERVLVVDDEAPLVHIMKRQLLGLGYTATGCTSGREALEIIDASPEGFDLVISDQTMPDITGVDLITHLREHHPDLPVILCTGFSGIINEEGALAVGARAFLGKPITRQVLAATVRTVLDQT